jgi:hypothetical protein
MPLRGSQPFYYAKQQKTVRVKALLPFIYNVYVILFPSQNP